MKRILLADDDAAITNSVARMLRILDYNVVVASDGSIAWKQLCHPDTRFDLIVSDYRMPNMNGVELLKQVRKTERTKRIPFILMSAGRTTRDGADLQDICADLNAHFKQKPCPDLVEIIEGTLN